MLLPNREEALIPFEKLTLYLLSDIHPTGKHKAQLFRAYGYSLDNARTLERDLLFIGSNKEVLELVHTLYGTKYTIDGTLTSPSGSKVHIRTVWIIKRDETIPRLVTAYPLTRK